MEDNRTEDNMTATPARPANQIEAMRAHGVRIPSGVFTIKNNETGEHRTFRVRLIDDEDSPLNGQRTVSMLTGADNTRDYTQFAFAATSAIHVFKKKRASAGQKPSQWQVFAAMLQSYFLGGWGPAMTAKYSVEEARRCWHCNRLLTTPESIRYGVGPICAVNMA